LGPENGNVHKITNVPVFYMELGINDLAAGKSITPAIEGVDPESLVCFGLKWHSLRSLPFQGSKKSQFSGPTPSNGPCNGFARCKIITSSAIYT
jgi:hypothetical protein